MFEVDIMDSKSFYIQFPPPSGMIIPCFADLLMVGVTFQIVVFNSPIELVSVLPTGGFMGSKMEDVAPLGLALPVTNR